jgi:hypothetical protein
MHLVNCISTFCPLFSIASSAEKGLGSFQGQRPILFTKELHIKTAEEPWSINASNIMGKVLLAPLIKQHQYK